jgi:hypothetical protein
MAYPISAVALTAALTIPTSGAGGVALSAPITVWIGPSGTALITISAILTLAAADMVAVSPVVNGSTVATAINHQNIGASSALATASGSRVLVVANGLVANAINTFTTLATSNTGAAVCNSGAMIVQPI